jgi:hypothetical protein
VLIESGGDYSFRYPYMYYHLKGKYIRDNLASETVRDYVSRCCEHLYVRDNANTILFLAHHTNDEWLLDRISNSLGTLFKKYLPVTFDSDTANIRLLMSEAPAITFRGGTPHENRARINRRRDEMEDDTDDGLQEHEESQPELSIPAQLAMLFKTTEILGQVLKNQYSTIKRGKKRELISELFSTPMRALATFYREFEQSPEKLISDVQEALSKRSKGISQQRKEAIARRVVAEIIQAITVGLLIQPARNANSDDLAEDVHAVVEENGTLAFRLIQLAIELDSAKSIPRKLITALYDPNKDDVVVSTAIKILAFNRLYMFKTTEPDMKWLSSKLDISLPMQHAISYQQSGRKLS